MNNIELINENEALQTISTIEIAEMMDMRHDTILRKLNGDKKSKGIISTLTNHEIVVSDYFIEGAYIDSSGKLNKAYKCTKLGCDFLANKFTGEKGILFTAKYVKRFNDMEQMIVQQQYKLPGSYKEALLFLANAEEEKEQIQLQLEDSNIIIDTLIKDEGLYSVGLLGKILKSKNVELGRNGLFKYLRCQDILMSAIEDGYKTSIKHNLPKALYDKYFVVKIKDGVNPVVYFNKSGVKWILKRLKRQGYITLDIKNEIYNELEVA